MIRIAKSEDLKFCLELLSQLGSSTHYTSKYLYLDSNTNGFTILVEKQSKPIAISTFSIRKTKRASGLKDVLYWENLAVDKNHRDGLAYIKIVSFVRKLIKEKKFDDIYFVVRRKNALKIHKAANFKVFGYLHLTFHSIFFWKKSNIEKGNEIMTYKEFVNGIDNLKTFVGRSLSEFKGLEHITEEQLKRQVSIKNGRVIIDCKNKNILFLRNLFSNLFIEINLLVPGCYQQPISGLSLPRNALININLCLVKSITNKKRPNQFLNIFSYNALNLSGESSLESFQIWEHDAW